MPSLEQLVQEKRDKASFPWLAERLEVSTPTAYSFVSRHPAFPIHRDKNGSRYFLKVEVEKYLEENGIGPRLAGDTTKTRLDNGGKIGSASDRRVTLAGDLLEIKIEKERGTLIDRDELTAVFTQKFARMGKMLDILPTKIAKTLDIPMELQVKIVDKMRKEIDAARLAITRGDEAYFGLEMFE